jgi:phage pi2 protein 07
LFENPWSIEVRARGWKYMPLDSMQMHLQDALSAKLLVHPYFQKSLLFLQIQKVGWVVRSLMLAS